MALTPKTLSNSDLSRATYARFSNNGVTVDVQGFLSTSTGQKMLKGMKLMLSQKPKIAVLRRHKNGIKRAKIHK